ncbi:HAMP domain-containing sensor histidine kinase [Kitasatospora paracochleata]|uniref:histidine kinase n=1 Tax=Kitasatospora paracochleata TaxID=58354 RepID=A0ABT1IXW6_9ACTN|nr:HAMP domain-containing sensor histidine kinase [Kitasatospora paracochleata]MCP2309371.1 two-component system sensor histidine kinase BaeS [Kitasatospora paracochleata]
MAAPIPLRRSLLVRLLAASCLIAACAIAATAWLTTSTTSQALARKQGQTLAADADILTQLSGYAATHTDWSGIGPLLQQLASGSGMRITLVGSDGTRIASSSTSTAGLPTMAMAGVDPLHFDTYTEPGAQRPGIDPRLVGPYRLTAEESEQQRSTADRRVTCLANRGVRAKAVKLPSGRYTVTSSDREALMLGYCGMFDEGDATAGEQPPLDELTSATAACLERAGVHVPPYLTVTAQFALMGADLRQPDQLATQGDQCLMQARRAQLQPYAAPAAQLYVDTGAPDGWRFEMTADNYAKVAWTATLVLLVTLAVSALVGRRLVRPLRALIHTAGQDPDDFALAPVTTRDETGYLAVAFNHLTERRRQTDEQRKAMVADIAHELRTPLTNIRGWLEVTRDGLVEPTPELIGSLHDEALVLQRVIEDLQDLASADAGTLRLHPAPLDTGDLLRQVTAAHRAEATANGLDISLDATPHLDLVADSDRLRQVLGNLVSNAVRHTPPGGHITLACRGDRDTVEITVVDTGTGIDPDDLVHVFDRFWRAEKSRSRRTGGSGLGLAIARQLVHAHGGTIDAASTLGEGTTMTLRLPRHSGQAPGGLV